MWIRAHGRIGMRGFSQSENLRRRRMNCQQFLKLIDEESKHRYRLSITHLNFTHFLHNHTKSKCVEKVKNVFIFLMNDLMPVGILSIDQLNEADDTLEMIESFINDAEEHQTTIEELSAQFYSMISHSGEHSRRPSINTIKLFKMKKAMIKYLRSVLEPLHTASKMNPLDYFYRSWLNAELHPLLESSLEFNALKECIENTQHEKRSFELETILKVDAGASAEFEMDVTDRYLIHSTYPSNILLILRDGLMVKPDHIHSFNNRLGKGIYFWDAAEIALKRFNHETIAEAILLVCRVKLGKQKLLPSEGDFTVTDLSVEGASFDSIFSAGSKFSQIPNEQIKLNDISMANGKLADLHPSDGQADYNRYMVFNNNQVKVEYLLHFKRKKQGNE